MPPGEPTRKPNLLFLAVLGAVLIQLAPVWVVRDQIKNGRSDFSGFYSAGQIVATGHGRQLYDLETQREAQRIFPTQSGRPALLPFNHPPFEALIFVPLSLLPYPAAFALWTACNMAMWIGVLFLLRPYLPSLQKDFDLALIAISLFMPLLFNITQGQDSILALFLFAFCFVSLIRNRTWLAGGALACAMFRPQLAIPAMLVLALAHRQRWKLLTGFLSTCFALGLLSVALVGWRALASYPEVLLHYIPEGGIINPASMPTLRALLNALLGQRLPPPVLYLCIALLSAILLGAASAEWRAGYANQDLLPLHYGFVVTATVLAAFHGYMHDSALLILPILFASNWLIQKRINTVNRGFLAASIAALFILPMFFKGGQIFCCATLAFFVALWYELRHNRAPGNPMPHPKILRHPTLAR
jgi:alpha-1,2-mannosyltransferase